MKTIKGLVKPILAGMLAVSVGYAFAVDPLAGQRGQGQSAGQGQGQGQGMGRGAAQQNAMPTFADFDLNGDGKITETEFTEARTARISERATEGRQMRGLADISSFADIDTNNDGSISPEEFAAEQETHRQQMGR